MESWTFCRDSKRRESLEIRIFLLQTDVHCPRVGRPSFPFGGKTVEKGRSFINMKSIFFLVQDRE